MLGGFSRHTLLCWAAIPHVDKALGRVGFALRFFQINSGSRGKHFVPQDRRGVQLPVVYLCQQRFARGGSANTEPVDTAGSHLQSLGTTTGGDTLHSLGGKYSTRACASPWQGRVRGGPRIVEDLAGHGGGPGRSGGAKKKKSQCSLHVVKYKMLKNNTVCGAGPSQLQGCWRCSETQKGV